MAYNFGAGTAWVTRTDISNPTPGLLGTLQDVELDYTFATKELMGQYQSPVAVAFGALKITAKAKFATIRAATLGAYFGTMGTSSAGLQAVALNEAGSIPATPGPYTVTVANSANFVGDLGVVYSATGVAFTRVASSPAQGQYSLAAGVYTFASADQGTAVLISYTWTAATGGTKYTLTNQLMGSTVQFQTNLAQSFKQNGVTKVLNIQLNACVAPTLKFPFKNQDFSVQEMDIQAFADASNTIGTVSVTDA